MRSIGGEARNVLECILQAGNHVIQGNGQALKLVPCLDHWQPLAQIGGGYTFGVAGDIRDRAQRFSHQPITTYHSQ